MGSKARLLVNFINGTVTSAITVPKDHYITHNLKAAGWTVANEIIDGGEVYVLLVLVESLEDFFVEG